MSALYHSYEQELSALLVSLKARQQQADSDERFSEDLREAESLATQLEIEARASGAGGEMRARIQGFRDDVKALRERFALLGGSSAKGNRNRTGPREAGVDARLLDDEEALDRSAQVRLSSPTWFKQTFKKRD